MELQDTALLAIKLAAGDKISQNAVYHRACLVALYNRAIARAKNIDKDKNQANNGLKVSLLLSWLLTWRIHISKVTQLPYLD